MKRAAACILILLLQAASGRPDAYPRQPDVDVTHYEIRIELNDGSDSISGTTRIRVRIRGERAAGMWLDLSGMQVDRMGIGGKTIPFTHRGGRLSFRFDREYARGETVEVEVGYHGNARNTGLRIAENRHGRRVYFSDNWPDLARRWFPSIDHPSDKAAVDFVITAPAKYTVVANGRLVRTERLPGGRERTRWTESAAIPTYSMAFGAAEFSVTSGIEALGVPVSWYVFPEDAAAAERKFGRTEGMLRYFCERIGPYPFEKLAHVESLTRMAAMENANTIFYSESLFYPDPVSEDPVPHEIAHQWFGNSVTPADWDHLWLSEGFATYFDALFCARTDGAFNLKEVMAGYAERVFAYPAARSRPVVDPGLADLTKKLNPLNYEKGAWILHMLRGLAGDGAFFEGIRRYYGRHGGGNVRTEDFREAMESATGRDLGAFFRQWLHQPGWPEYRLEWKWDERSRALSVDVRQMQKTGLFDMPLDLVIRFGNREEIRRIRIGDKDVRLRLPAPLRPSSVEIDPEGWVLKSVSVAPQ
ncbi:MAG: M1 family metallopeptidase [Acidobacteria bacterium]|nr:M1 family metallopeptidase [Acidobacteriota bacterium]